MGNAETQCHVGTNDIPVGGLPSVCGAADVQFFALTNSVGIFRRICDAYERESCTCPNHLVFFSFLLDVGQLSKEATINRARPFVKVFIVPKVIESEERK